MKHFKINSCNFDVDVEETKQYYESITLCNCVGCSNFYLQVKTAYPSVAEFLNKFGVNIEKPDEIFWTDIENGVILYNTIDYTVSGSFRDAGDVVLAHFNDGKVKVYITSGFVCPNSQQGEYFTLSVVGIELPTILEYPKTHIISGNKRGIRGIFNRIIEKIKELRH
ncbi:MAG: hypothetical protein E7597_08405 [Ruminococcaceae bacterium]|nr:hypothetical protein [Oscillospiraceae bacterium]